MDQYALAIFPAFIWLGARGQNAWGNRAVVYLSFPLQLYPSARFVLWEWVKENDYDGPRSLLDTVS